MPLCQISDKIQEKPKQDQILCTNRFNTNKKNKSLRKSITIDPQLVSSLHSHLPIKLPNAHHAYHISSTYATHFSYQGRNSNHHVFQCSTSSPSLPNSKRQFAILHSQLYSSKEKMVPRLSRSGTKLRRVQQAWRNANEHHNSAPNSMGRFTSLPKTTNQSSNRTITYYRNPRMHIPSTIALPMEPRWSENNQIAVGSGLRKRTTRRIPRFMGLCSELSLSPPVAIRATNPRKSGESNGVDRKGLRC